MEQLNNPYNIAHDGAILVELGERGRFKLTDRDRLELINRMSTNQLMELEVGQGAATVLTTPVGRIIDMVVMLHDGDDAYMITGEGRGAQILNYLRRNIFFNDRVQVTDLFAMTVLVGLYGSSATTVLASLVPEAVDLPLFNFVKYNDVVIMRAEPLAGDGYWLMGERTTVDTLTHQLQHAGAAEGDATTLELLRIESGQPAVEKELTEDYIPLEVGLWDKVSFNKGCYTGQEIIARMESRRQLAKMLVRLKSDVAVAEGTELFVDKTKVGTLTSIAQQTEHQFLGLGFVKTAFVSDGAVVQTSTGQALKILGIAGSQPER